MMREIKNLRSKDAELIYPSKGLLDRRKKGKAPVFDFGYAEARKGMCPASCQGVALKRSLKPKAKTEKASKK